MVVRTLADLAGHSVRRFPDRPIVRQCRGDTVVDTVGQTFSAWVRDLSLGLQALGLDAGDRVAIVGDGSPAWCATDLAVLATGGVTVPVYPTLTSAQTAHILNDSGARLAVVSNRVQVEKLTGRGARLPALATIAVMEADGAPWPENVVTLTDVAARGRQRLMARPNGARRFDDGVEGLDDQALATIIYTSGTTGEPKGVMLTHANLLSNVTAAVDLLRVTPDDVALSFLPISHAFERMAVYTYLYAGAVLTFAESMNTLARDMRAVRPTVMTAVPRVFEKLRARIEDSVAQASPPRRALVRWAFSAGARRSTLVRRGQAVGPTLALQDRLADRLVFGRIRAATGGRLRVLVSGGAPLPRLLAEFFDAVGLTIIEGYGLTEAAPVLTVNPIDRPKFGTVGRALPGVELRIAADGEVLARGPNVMRGYYNKPDATHAVLDSEGWLHTGDIGTIDDEGYLTIVDRQKDLLITAGGKHVAPQPVEDEIRRHPLVAEAVLIGDRRPFIAALVVPDFPALERHLAARRLAGAAHDALVCRPDVIALYQPIVDAVNATRAPFETVKRFALIPAAFTIEGGELTPTLKVKRRVVEQRWAATIDALYLAEPPR